MSKKSSGKAKRLEALEKSQGINKYLESSTIESEALLSSAGESRPSQESHVLDLLEQDKFPSESPSSGSKKKSPAKKKLSRKRR